jgi:hypothetical protein
MKTCKQLVNKKWKDTKKTFDGYFKSNDYEGLSEYGLDIRLIEADTYEGQDKPYIIYQLSWGGPADEVRLYEDGTIEYWYLDWFDGASVDITEDDTAQKIATYMLEVASFS